MVMPDCFRITRGEFAGALIPSFWPMDANFG